MSELSIGKCKFEVSWQIRCDKPEFARQLCKTHYDELRPKSAMDKAMDAKTYEIKMWLESHLPADVLQTMSAREKMKVYEMRANARKHFLDLVDDSAETQTG